MSKKVARLVLADGMVFKGSCFTELKESIGEVVFNTSMMGYQEVCSDPSYAGQFVVLCYPHIGNYGYRKEDMQSKRCHLKGLLVHHYCDTPSHFQSEGPLHELLNQHHCLGMSQLDTRSLTKHLRDFGSQMGIITCSDEPVESLIKKIKAHPPMIKQELVKSVSTTSSYNWQASDGNCKVGVLDFGVKYGILNSLKRWGCNVTVYPYNTPADQLINDSLDAVLLSNGPGDPEQLPDVIDNIKSLLGHLPIFGICLGHQLLSLALGLRLCKLGFGHHGSNHPILNTETKKIEISSQNHLYNIDPNAIMSTDIEVTHINLNDQSIAGIRIPSKKAFSVQFHPESCPGPHDSDYLFEAFIHLIKTGQLKSFKECSYA